MCPHNRGSTGVTGGRTRHSWLGSRVCVLGYGFRLLPAFPGLGLSCLCLGLGIAVTWPFLGGV